jgi:hypothetical protein
MGRFAASLTGKKVFNHREGFGAKVEIRRNVLGEIGDASVFDAFAGPGEMYRAVWREARHYVGCDKTWYRDDRIAFVADNRRVLRCINLSAFNVFDLDSFGSPWEQATIIAARRKVKAGERIGLILTEGSGLKLKMGQPPAALAELCGLQGKIAGLIRGKHELIHKAIGSLARQMNCQVTRRWQADREAKASVSYIGLVLCGRDFEVRAEDCDSRAVDISASRA